MKPVYFKKWATDWPWGIRIALFLILLSALVQLGMFLLTQNYLVSYLGAQPEDIWFAVMLTYAGIITILPIQFRFLRYFETRNYLIFNIIFAITMNIVCLHCQDIILFFCIRFLQGMLTGNVIVCTLTLILSRVHPERSQTVGSAVFYGTILSNTVLVGFVAGIVVESEDWKTTYYYLILLQIFTLAIALLMLRRTTGHKRYPLYQLDWIGLVIFAFAVVSLSYTILYGSKYYWFEDPRICLSSACALIGSILFFYKQSITKRPVLHLEVFKSGKFLIGLCLLIIYYGSKDSMNLIYNYAGGFVKWSLFQVITLGLCNIAGLVIFLAISIRIILIWKVPTSSFFIPGFALLGIFNLWMYFLMSSDLSFSDLLLPVFLQGAASGILFVPLMLFVLTSAPANTGPSGLIIAAYARFTTTLNSFAGFYNLQLYYNQYFKEGFLGHINSENPNTVERLNFYKNLYVSKGFTADQATSLANSAIAQNLAQQSQLLTNRAIFMTFAIVLLGIALLILVVTTISKSQVFFRKRKNLAAEDLYSAA